MSVAIITGSVGLVGSEAARYFAAEGIDVVGIDNDLRAYFLGPEASTAWNRARLEAELPNYEHAALDIRDAQQMERLFAGCGRSTGLVRHAAAQPSHDWAAREPLVDFDVNARPPLALIAGAAWASPAALPPMKARMNANTPANEREWV